MLLADGLAVALTVPSVRLNALSGVSMAAPLHSTISNEWVTVAPLTARFPQISTLEPDASRTLDHPWRSSKLV